MDLKGRLAAIRNETSGPRFPVLSEPLRWAGALVFAAFCLVPNIAAATIGGATNVSDGIVPTSDAESQTAAVAVGNFLASSYIVFYDPVHEVRSTPLSQIGVSYLSGASEPFTWRALHLPVPAGMAALRATSSITYRDLGSTYEVYVSAVGITTSAWPGYPADISYDTYKAIHPNRVCVMTVNLPKSGAAASLTTSNCFSATAGDYYWYTAMTSIGGNTPLVAAWNREPTYRVDFFTINGSPLSNPFPGKTIAGGPIFAKGSQVDLIAPDSAGTFWWARYNPSNGTWSPAVAMSPTSSGFVWLDSSLPFGITGESQYDAVVSNGVFALPSITLFYRTGSSLAGWSRFVTSGSVLTNVFTSRAGFSAFQPSVEVAAVPNEFGAVTGLHPMLTYQDNSGPNGAIVLNMTWVGRPVVALGAAQVPCPVGVAHYWGSKDEMAVRKNNSGSPELWRFFTDSTKTSCTLGEDEFFTTTGANPNGIFTPQHVSAVPVTVPSGSVDGGGVLVSLPGALLLM